jgi:SAM-dependent methyltransferase
MKYCDIINTLKSKYEKDKKLDTYLKYIELLEKSGEYVNKISRKTFLLDSIRVYLLDNPDRYNIFLSTKKSTSEIFSVMKLSDKSLNNLLLQIIIVEKHGSNIFAFGENIEIPQIICKRRKSDQKNKLYILIVEKNKPDPENFIKIENHYDSFGYLFGKHTEKILNYQLLDNIKVFLSSEDGIKVIRRFQSYIEYAHTLSYWERDRIFVHSGSIFLATGTTYTSDVDIIYAKYNSSKSEVNDLLKEMKQTYPYFDMSIMDDKLKIFTKPDIIPLEYKSNWFIYILPSLANADNLYNIICSSMHHLTFLGVRFFSLDINIARFLQRASPTSIADLYALKELNGYDVDICMPISTIRQGKWQIFYDKHLERFYDRLKKLLYKFYGKSKTLEELKKEIQLCCNKENSYSIYKGHILYDKDTSVVKYFHIQVKKIMYSIYANNASSLLDIGTGKLTDLRFWQQNKIGHIDGIEPSDDSVNKANAKLKKFNIKNIQLIHNVGDSDWSLNGIRKKLMKSYDIISFQFCIHYMMPNIDILMKNILSVSRPKTKILITCIDGNLVQKTFSKTHKKIELRNTQEPIFGIAPLYKVIGNDVPDDKNILVYFKGSYGLSMNGSIERIIDVNKFINLMKHHKFKLIESKNFNLFKHSIRKNMNEAQKTISNYYKLLVFEKE